MTTKKIRRSEVDGTVPGVALLVVADLANPDSKVFQDRFSEPESANPHAYAYALWNSVKEDFPNHDYSIVINERARYLMAANRVEALLGEPYTIEEYLES